MQAGYVGVRGDDVEDLHLAAHQPDVEVGLVLRNGLDGELLAAAQAAGQAHVAELAGAQLPPDLVVGVRVLRSHAGAQKHDVKGSWERDPS